MRWCPSDETRIVTAIIVLVDGRHSRPEKLNTLSVEMLTEAAQAIDLAGDPTVALGPSREQVMKALIRGFDDLLEVEQDHQQVAGAARDIREGMAAFAEGRRSPVFPRK
ncbi:hypothetical protein [uncultured Hyphomonas sp.]|uniref:hypothetical protein n=1 Tax=uncultured Hyphomonas sp. TaxID=225298 RepID=UPI000C39A951|nr:hypothetical protein [Hyphomonadaceae bacterium]MBA27672.1 hypothetical protein [Hyphomonadaceae bacterium]|tara:strand:- start:54914 stop:55240 length:327 start_codon:yes stop_codon:yes gene_type:complete